MFPLWMVEALHFLSCVTLKQLPWVFNCNQEVCVVMGGFAILDINRNPRLDIFTAGHKMDFGLVREKQLSKKILLLLML